MSKMSIGTIDTKYSTLGLNKDIFGDLSELTIIAEDFGEEPDSEFANSLIEMGRKVVYQDDCTVRIGGTQAKAFEGRMYILNDTIIVGKYKKLKRKGSKHSVSTLKGRTQDKIIFGKDIIATRDDLDNDFDAMTVPTQGTLRQEGKTLKLKLWVTLNGSGTQVRDINKDPDHGIKIIYTTKEMKEIGTEIELVTNVDQTEVFFGDKEEAELFAGHIHNTIDDILVKELGELDELSMSGSFSRSNSGVSATMREVDPYGGDEDDGTVVPDDGASQGGHSVSTRRSGRVRAHMKGKATTKRFQRSRNTSKTAAPLTLADLESKYKVKFQPKAQADTAEFSVSFKQGSMGFALSSSGTHGVFVGKIEDNGMADLSGVTLGDRVVEIGGEIIEDEMSWQECIQIIKAKRSELNPSGNQKPLVIKFARNREVEDNIAKEKAKQKQAEKKARVKHARNRKRDWKTKRDRNKGFGTRMQSLKDLESKYRNRGEAEKTQKLCDDLFEKVVEQSEDKKEKKCAFIMKEIYDTEKKYVSDLYMLKDSYITRLCSKQVPMRCQELQLTSHSKFCPDHHVPFRRCEKDSSTKKKLLSREDKKILFMNVEVITQLNERLLAALQKGLVKLAEKSETEKVDIRDILGIYSPAFIRLMPFYALYSQYASRYAKAMDRYQYLKETNLYFNEEMEQIFKKKDVKSLSNLLISPITRLTKYPLLFNTLTQAFQPYFQKLVESGLEEKEIDRISKLVEDLQKTNYTVEKVASNVDFKVDEHGKNEELNVIYKELGGLKYIKEFFKPSRKFVARYEGVSIIEKKKLLKDKVLLVFNDLIIIASYRKGGKKPSTNSDKRITKGSKASVTSLGKGSFSGKNSSGRGRGFFNLTKRGGGSLLKIDYMSEMKRVRSVIKQDTNQEDQHGVQLFLASFASEEQEKKKSKKQKEVDASPRVAKIDVYFEELKYRDSFNNDVVEQKETLKNKDNGRKAAKVALTNARSHLKEARRRLMQKANRHGNAAGLSQYRQNDLKAKLEAQRKRNTLKKG